MDPESLDTGSKEILLADFRYVSECFWRNEELGDRRVNFFITLTTAVIGASVVLVREDISKLSDRVVAVFFLALAALLLFGILTLVRMIRRNLETDKYKLRQDRLRLYFAVRDPNIREHLAFDPYKPIPGRKKEWEWMRLHEVLSFGRGGLVETVALVNCMIAAMFSALLILRILDVGIAVNVPVSVAVGLVAWVIQKAYVNWRYGCEESRSEAA
jgi:hypothetical protein